MGLCHVGVSFVRSPSSGSSRSYASLYSRSVASYCVEPSIAVGFVGDNIPVPLADEVVI